MKDRKCERCGTSIPPKNKRWCLRCSNIIHAERVHSSKCDGVVGSSSNYSRMLRNYFDDTQYERCKGDDNGD